MIPSNLPTLRFCFLRLFTNKVSGILFCNLMLPFFLMIYVVLFSSAEWIVPKLPFSNFKVIFWETWCWFPMKIGWNEFRMSVTNFQCLLCSVLNNFNGFWLKSCQLELWNLNFGPLSSSRQPDPLSSKADKYPNFLFSNSHLNFPVININSLKPNNCCSGSLNLPSENVEKNLFEIQISMWKSFSGYFRFKHSPQ